MRVEPRLGAPQPMQKFVSSAVPPFSGFCKLERGVCGESCRLARPITALRRVLNQRESLCAHIEGAVFVLMHPKELVRLNQQRPRIVEPRASEQLRRLRIDYLN